MSFKNLLFESISSSEFTDLFVTHPIDDLSIASSRNNGHNLLLEPRNTTFPKSNRANNASILVCHDMAGGYHSDASHYGNKYIHPYQLLHTHLVDALCYFSHHLISIPPLSWRSLCRRHNISIYGTFLTEWEAGAVICNKHFACRESTLILANQLILLAEEYGLDGWLINIENKLDSIEIENVKFLLRQLTTSSSLDIIWYDAVTCSGELVWQNEVNCNNSSYAHAAGSILLNYCWTGKHITTTLCSPVVHSSNMYFGIDVFGRGAPGGYNIKSDRIDTLTAASSVCPSVALFAPGWLLEEDLKSEVQIACEASSETCHWLELQRQIEIKSEKFWAQLKNYAPAVAPPFITEKASHYTWNFSAPVGLGVVYLSGQSYPHYFCRYTTGKSFLSPYYDLSLQDMCWDVSLLSTDTVYLYYETGWRGASCLCIDDAYTACLVPSHMMPSIACSNSLRVKAVLGWDIVSRSPPVIVLSFEADGTTIEYRLIAATSTGILDDHCFVYPLTSTNTTGTDIPWTEYIFAISPPLGATLTSLTITCSGKIFIGEIGIEVTNMSLTSLCSPLLSNLEVGHSYYCAELRRWSVVCSWSSNSNYSVAFSGFALFRWKDEKATEEIVSQVQCDHVSSGSGLLWANCLPNVNTCTTIVQDKYEILLLTRAVGARLCLNENEDFTLYRRNSCRVCIVSVVPQLVSYSDVDICTCPTFVFMTAPHA